MVSMNLIKLFWITNIILWTFLFAVTLLMGNTSILRKRGYSEDYISFMRKDYTNRAIIMAIVIPLIQIAAFFVVKVLVKDVSSHTDLVLLVFILLVLPFPFIDNILTRKKLKLIQEKTNEAMVVDLKHKVLHLIYKPTLELVLTIIVIAYALLVVKPVIIFYLHILLPWIFYFMAYNSKMTTRPHLKDGYIWVFVFIIINFGLVIYYIINGLVRFQNHLTTSQLSLGVLLTLILCSRVIYYFVNYAILRQKL